ncbi:hypothetical protein ANCCEY_12112 [Ancylostoma ceylanicum]|uniref:Biotin carboxylase-like N-terminal domain-containing protein n=1 Tax=Ancylostoma ceylanicum TaxID=53326 RepID=A0A0D6LMF6_9BILA|nr:hypothetical protein ANCCEY_12112 [Ancylostoma ceylanicum]
MASPVYHICNQDQRQRFDIADSSAKIVSDSLVKFFAPPGSNSPEQAPISTCQVLVASRGEVALRVFRTLREIEVESIGIYAHEDRFSQHRQSIMCNVHIKSKCWLDAFDLMIESYCNFEEGIANVCTFSFALTSYSGFTASF